MYHDSSILTSTTQGPRSRMIPTGDCNEASSTPQPNVLPLGIVSPEMASKLIDELMRVIEEQAEVKLTSVGDFSVEDVSERKRALQDTSSVYSQKNYYDVNKQTDQVAPPAVVYYSALHKQNAGGPPPRKFSRTRESIHTTDETPPDHPVNHRGSKFILIDQTQTHSFQRVASQQSNMHEPKEGLPQRYPARMDSIYQGDIPPPSLTPRRHSIDANQSYMTPSDTASVHETSENSVLNFKKWIGARKAGSRATSQKLVGPVVVEAKKAPIEKAPTVSKSKSFFSQFKYEIHPTPMYGYVAPPKKKVANPADHNKGSQRLDGSSSTATSIRKVESTTRSSIKSTNSKEKKQNVVTVDSAKWALSPPSRAAPVPQVCELAAIHPSSSISHLAWNDNIVPVHNTDFQHVEGWLSDTHAETASPVDPLLPVFSENSFASTAPTSSDESNRLSVVLEGRHPAFVKGEMQSSIISWVDLGGCTSDFVQSLQVLGIVQGVEPILTPIDGADEGSILFTPSSKYMDEALVGVPKDALQTTITSNSLPGNHCLSDESQSYPSQPLAKISSSRSQSTSQSILNSKPLMTPLVIPASSHSIFPISTKPLSSLPATTSLDTITNTTVSHTPRTNFDDGDSPTLPTPIALPPRSLKHSKRGVGSPPTPSHTQYRQSFTNSSKIEEEDAPPPIPVRLRPITPPKTTTPCMFLAPPTGLVLNLVRQYVSQTKSEWLITSPPTTTALLMCHLFPLLHKIEFTNPQTQSLLFTFSQQRSGACSWIAESAKGELLFSIMEAMFGRWSVVVNDGGKGKKWAVNVDDLDEGIEMDVFCEGDDGKKEAGRIVARGRNTYGINVKPGCDFAIMACLTTIFDEWRVDEGFF